MVDLHRRSKAQNSTLALNLEPSLQSNTLIVNHYKTVFLSVWSSHRMACTWHTHGPSVTPGKQREERRAEWKTQRRQVRTPALCVPALFVSPHYWCPRIVSRPVKVAPKWAEQRLRLYGAQDRTMEKFFKKLEEGMAGVSMERHGRAKQLVVFFGAASIGTGGGWGADAVLRACCKVVCRPRGTDQRRGRVVLVDEHRTTRVSSAVNGQQPCERQLNKRRATRPTGWKPPAGQVEPRLLRPAWSQQRDQPVRGMMWCPVVAPRKPPQAPRRSQAATQAAASEAGPSTPLPAKRSKRTMAEPAAEPNKAKGKAVKAKPAPQPGRWLDRDCNAALNMQRIGESKWRPLELCFWPEQGKLPAKGKEYPGLGYKRLRDKPPKAQQQQPAMLTVTLLWSSLKECMRMTMLVPGCDGRGISTWCEHNPLQANAMDRAGSLFIEVIKVPEGAVVRGCKKTRRKLRAHLQLRAEFHSQLRVIASLFPASMECDIDSDSEPDCGSEPEPQSDSGSESEPEPVTQPPQRCCSARLAALAPAAPTGPPLPLDCEDPVMLRQLKDFCKFFANPNSKTVYNQLQRRLVRPRQRRHPMLMPIFEDPSNQALLAKLQDLGNINLRVAPRKPPQAPGGSQEASQPAASEPGPSTPPPAKRTKAEPAAEPTKSKGKAKGKAVKAKPAPQPGRWLDRDCNAALNMQRIGESRWRPLELCYWPEQGALPTKGKEYPGLGYKRLRDNPPKAQQQQQPAEA
ncbi:hypothetical protein QJQ45_029419, partial [Haematococcus lacustris]